MNPIIILGMDNTGKTTLQEGLERELKNYFKKANELKGDKPIKSILELASTKVKTIKSPGPLDRKAMHEWCYTQMIRFNTPTTELEIYDRFGCIDEQIYAPIVRKNNQLDHVEHLTQLLKELPIEAKPLFIYSRPSTDKIIGFEDGREQMEGVEENAKELLSAYDELYFKLAADKDINIVTYSYEKETPAEMVAAYIGYMLGQKEALYKIDLKELVRFLLEPVEDINPDNMSLEDLRTLQLDYRLLLSLFTNLWRALELQGKELEKPVRENLLKEKLKIAKAIKKVDEKILNLL